MDLALFLRALAVLVFAGAAWTDHRTRTAPNVVWALLLIIGAVAFAIDAIGTSDPLGVTATVATVAIAFGGLALLAWRAGVIGGADAKAIIVLPVVFPRLPGQAIQNGVFPALTQGVEVVIVVWTVTGIVGLWWPIQERRLGRETDGVPFLVPMWVGVVSLFVVGLGVGSIV